MAASDAKPVPRKNSAYRFYFAIRKPSDSTLITTWTGQDSEVSLDGAAFADCTNEATEIGTSGAGYIDLTASEMNADAVLLKVSVTNTGAVPLIFVLYPDEAGDYRADAVMVGGQTASASGTVTFPGTIASTTNITAGTITTVTNLTNAPTAGDLTATMKTSIGTAVAASAVASVTGNVGGNVTGTVGGIAGTTTTLDALQTALDAAHGAGSWATATGFSTLTAADVWAAGTRTLTSLSGLTVDTVTNLTNLPSIPANWLTAAGTAADFTTEIQSGLATAASIAALNNLSAAQVNAEVDTALTDVGLTTTVTGRIDAAVSSRMATFTYTTPPTAVQNRQEMDANSVGLAAIFARTDVATSTRATVGDIPTASQIATAWGVRDLGYGVTADEYLQGYLPRVVFAADGLTATVYCGDDTTVLQSLTATRLQTTVGGLRSTDPV
jgi:hypothetical protein